jgi:hypothetical protein
MDLGEPAATTTIQGYGGSQYKIRLALGREPSTGDGSRPARVHDAEDGMQVGTAISASGKWFGVIVGIISIFNRVL